VNQYFRTNDLTCRLRLHRFSPDAIMPRLHQIQCSPDTSCIHLYPRV